MHVVVADSLLVILTYYIGMIIWITSIYMFRDTLKIAREVVLEYKYDNGKLNYITNKVAMLYNKVLKNIMIVTVSNLLASIFCMLYVVILGVNVFLMVSVPLAFLLLVIVSLLGYYNNISNTDVHRQSTFLG